MKQFMYFLLVLFKNEKINNRILNSMPQATTTNYKILKLRILSLNYTLFKMIMLQKKN